MINKYIGALVGVLVFIGLMWLLHSIIEATDSGGSSVVGIIALVCIVIFVPISISAWLAYKRKSEEVIKKVVEKKHNNQLVNEVKNDLQKYQSYKHSYSHCSNEFLKAQHSVLLDKKIEDMEMLAIEEEMVQRGFLTTSPMHEKLLLIQRSFNS